MRIALISYHFPPDPAVGGLRAAKVAAALRRAGHEVHVISGLVPEAPRPRDVLPDGTVLERVRSWRGAREYWAKLKQRRGKAAAAQPVTAASGEHSAMPAGVPFWKRQIFALLWLPDDHQGFIVPAIRAAMLAFPGGPDLVYTSAPPFSAHLAGLRLARKGIRWIAEFRDPWTDNPWKPAHVRTSWSDSLERWLERRTLARAERIVAVSAGIARVMRGKLPPERQGQVLLARNGIEWLAPDAAPPKHPGIRSIVHVGSFYFGRDPRPFLSAFAEVASRHGLSPERVRVDLVGKCRWFNGISVEAEAAKLGIQDFIRFQDWVPHEACQQIVRTADVLLLLAQHQPDQVPNKLYEYLGTRRPILAFADEEGETAEMLRATGGHAIVTSDRPEDAIAALEDVLGLGGRPSPATPDARKLDSWTTDAQMCELLQAVEARQ